MYCGWGCETACNCWYWNAWIGCMCDAFAIIVCVWRLVAVTFVVSGVDVIGTTLAFIIDALPTGAVPITTTPLFTDNVLMQFFCSNVVIFVAATCAPFVCCEIFIKLSVQFPQRLTYNNLLCFVCSEFIDYFFVSPHFLLCYLRKFFLLRVYVCNN